MYACNVANFVFDVVLGMMIGWMNSSVRRAFRRGDMVQLELHGHMVARFIVVRISLLRTHTA